MTWYFYPHSALRYGVAVVLAALAVGCQSRGMARHAVSEPQPIGLLTKPMIDLSHGGAGFPLISAAVPKSADVLADSLRTAYTDRLEDGGTVTVAVEPAVSQSRSHHRRSFDSIDIDLTGSTVKPAVVAKADAPATQPVGITHVRWLSYVAQPLKHSTFAVNIGLAVTEADLAAFPGGDGRLTLALVDCTSGQATLKVTQSDLRQGILAMFKAKLKNNLTAAVDRVDLTLASERPNTLYGQMVLHTRVLLLPATIELRGRLDVAGNHILFTELYAHGRDPAGAIAAAFLQEKLDVYNNKIGPILRMPGNRIHVTNVAFSVDQNLTIDATFAGKPVSND